MVFPLHPFPMSVILYLLTVTMYGWFMTLKFTHEDKNVVLNWLRNQFTKHRGSIFLNPEIAQLHYMELLTVDVKGKRINVSNDMISPLEVEDFVDRFLSENALKRLKTTLRVSAHRAAKNGFPLQVNISYSSKQKLDFLARKTGLKKNEIIDKLIELSDLDKVIKKEEQLEITL
jgi:hypothetical protein